MKLVKNDNGMALIMAVAIVGILSGIAVTFAYNMKIEQKAAGNFKNYLKAKSLAGAGAAKARAILGIYANSDNYLWANFTTLNQSWALGSTELTGTIGSSSYVYDVRYTRIGTEGAINTEVNTLLDLTSGDDINGHIIRGVIDEESKLNIAVGENTNKDNLVLGLEDAGFITSSASSGLQLWNDSDKNTITQVLAASGCGYAALYGDDDGNGDAQLANNHKNDSNEANDGTANCLDGGIEDIITVSSTTIDEKDESGTTLRTVCPVNVNTASLPVLIAVLSRIKDETAGGTIGVTDATTISQAIIDYREGADGIEGNSDDNPFDGMNNIITVDGFADPGGDNLDNDGDGSDDEADEAYMFPGGARGEFNAFVDSLNPTYGMSLDSQEIANIKDNADPSPGIDYDNNGDSTDNDNCWTAPFCFKSKYFTIISEGRVLDDASNIMATYKIKQIAGPFEDDTLD